jgi:hypothetical protein
MKAILNRQLFEATVFDSGALGLVTSLVHQFTAPGVYRASVRRDGRDVGETAFEVRDDAPAMQLDIDLAATKSRARGDDDCCCGEPSHPAPPTVSTKGHVLFHATSGSGWSVHVGLGERTVFDSLRLTKGDMFALTLLEPTKYRVENTQSGARGSAEVSFTKADAARLKELQPLMVTAGTAFQPAELQLVSTQGLIFRVEADSRVVITRQERRQPEPKRGPIRFHRPRPPQPRPGGRPSGRG